MAVLYTSRTCNFGLDYANAQDHNMHTTDRISRCGLEFVLLFEHNCFALICFSIVSLGLRPPTFGIAVFTE